MKHCEVKQFFGWFALACILASCQISHNNSAEKRDLKEIKNMGELRVVVLQNSTSFFAKNSEELGFDYELACHFANHIGVEIKRQVALSEIEAKKLITSNKADLIAHKMPLTKANKKTLAFVDFQSPTFPVLIQRTSNNQVKVVADLVGKTVSVPCNSPYALRLKNLNAEIGGGINIDFLNDTTSVSSLALQVFSGEKTMTLANNDEAKQLKKSLPTLDISVKLGLEKECGWALNKDSEQLLSALNDWSDKFCNSLIYNKLYANYYGNIPFESSFFSPIAEGEISPYDQIFKRYAPEIGWDWRLLAALAYHESRFNVNTISSAGAMGLMQMMPITGTHFGLDSVTIFQPEPAVAAAVQYIKSLNLAFHHVDDQNERTKFILASYNAGPAHIFDAQALAEKYGENAHQWEIAKKYLRLKSDPEYYNDPVCQYGYFRANHTISYVRKVYKTYFHYLGIDIQN